MPQSAFALECEATNGFFEYFTKSQKPASERWEESAMMPSSFMRASASMPKGLSPFSGAVLFGNPRLFS